MSIWNYNKINDVSLDFQLSLNEGSTPLEPVQFEGQTVNLKLETHNPNHSFKDRSLAYQISAYHEMDKNRFVISSSGNAAISAAAYIQLMDAQLDIFVSNNVNPDKLSILRSFEDEKIKIHLSQKAKSDAIKHASAIDAINLRGSKDDYAIVGFKTIAYEIADQFPEVDAVFVPCSSGTSSLAIYQGFREVGLNVQLHICQTSKIHPIAKEFDTHFTQTTSSIADAITDRVAPRKADVLTAIKSSHGFGWIVSDEMLKELYDQFGGEYSYNSLLSLGGLKKAKQNGFTFSNPVAIISGT